MQICEDMGRCRCVSTWENVDMKGQGRIHIYTWQGKMRIFEDTDVKGHVRKQMREDMGKCRCVSTRENVGV